MSGGRRTLTPWALATLAVVLATAALPRPGLYYHHHAGGSAAHVHPDEDGVGHGDPHEDGHAHAHADGNHHHSAHHAHHHPDTPIPGRHASSAHADAAHATIGSTDGTEDTGHWHTQNPACHILLPQAPRLVARCAPDLAAAVAPLAARLGPRAGVAVEPTFAAGRFEIQEA